MKIGKGPADPVAMLKQTREESDSLSLPPLIILCLQTLLVITKAPEGGLGIAQVDITMTRLITF